MRTTSVGRVVQTARGQRCKVLQVEEGILEGGQGGLKGNGKTGDHESALKKEKRRIVEDIDR